MRYLTIVRHAESSPARGGGTDFDRVLSARGIGQCEEMRTWAQDPQLLLGYGPSVALVSAAARTRETFQRAFGDTAFVERVEFSELIYNGRRHVTGEDLLAELAAIDPVTSSLAVVGHNPTVIELMELLAKKLPSSLRKGHFALGGAYVLALDTDGPIGLGRYEIVAKLKPN